MRPLFSAFVRPLRRPALATMGALALAAAWPQTAAAQVIGVHVASQHIPYKQRYNNLNPGLYYRTPEGWVGGFYLNSLSRTSIYVGRTFEHGKFAVTLAGVSGYTHPVQALIVPSVEVGQVAGASVRLAYIPRVEKRIGSHVMHLMVEY